MSKEKASRETVKNNVRDAAYKPKTLSRRRLRQTLNICIFVASASSLIYVYMAVSLNVLCKLFFMPICL